MICPSCGTTLRVHDLRPWYTCPRCSERVVNPRYPRSRRRSVVLAILAVVGALVVVSVLTSWPVRLGSVGLLVLPLVVFVAAMIGRRDEESAPAGTAAEVQVDKGMEQPDMSLVAACASRLSALRAMAFAKGARHAVTFCLHPGLVDATDAIEGYRDALRILGVPGEMVETDVGATLCGAGKRDAAIRMLAAFAPGIEVGTWQDALAVPPAREWFYAVAVQPCDDAVEAVIAHVRYGGGDSRFVARLRAAEAAVA